MGVSRLLEGHGEFGKRAGWLSRVIFSIATARATDNHGYYVTDRKSTSSSFLVLFLQLLHTPRPLLIPTQLHIQLRMLKLDVLMQGPLRPVHLLTLLDRTLKVPLDLSRRPPEPLLAVIAGELRVVVEVFGLLLQLVELVKELVLPLEELLHLRGEEEGGCVELLVLLVVVVVVVL